MDDNEEKKDKYKPWGNVRTYFHLQASVLWPPDMPDEMLEDAISCTEIACKEAKLDIEGKGDAVLNFPNCLDSREN